MRNTCPRCGGLLVVGLEPEICVDGANATLLPGGQVDMPAVHAFVARCHRWPVCGYEAAGDLVGELFMSSTDVIPLRKLLREAVGVQVYPEDPPRHEDQKPDPGE